ncbi:NAD-dependent epimerase/dehydratase family protein [Frankia sp. AgPm24]|uniref:NAD-dependent epimerase/dehydratase family protein n=1 Tax=Frankia sp. AgPm24 TaxID=631128 RepID=UPI00200D9DF5|nr:NAD-dependent epimerase/dehydratase family protein [Frankia sp. AgPm24]MCK9923324.1 NAD-dependent epimerase/dehydratase family protein [Frankia sp. AgPm24]
MFVVGGQGYLGSCVIHAATGTDMAIAISRDGATRHGVPSTSWSTFLGGLKGVRGPVVVWLLDGAKHHELDRLAELLAARPDGHLVLVSTCTVYGACGDLVCDEGTPLDLRTDHARLKASCEALLDRSDWTWAVLRLGALYGVDHRGIRADRIEQWVRQGTTEHVITVPDPEHWRGWVHRDQAARALWRAAASQVTGVFNIASANLTFAQAAHAAAAMTDAKIIAAGEMDPCSYRVDSSAAVVRDLLDVEPGEDISAATEAFVNREGAHDVG